MTRESGPSALADRTRRRQSVDGLAGLWGRLGAWGGALLVTALALFAGCADSGTTSAPSTGDKTGKEETMDEGTGVVPDSAEEAETIFAAFVEKLAESGDGEIEAAAAHIKRRQLPPAVQLGDYASYAKTVTEAIGTAADELCLFGSPKDLPDTGACWTLDFPGLLSEGVAGCVDATTGRVMIVWLTPEG